MSLAQAHFFDELNRLGSSFFTGVPDSLLSSICAYVTDHAPPSSHVKHTSNPP